MSKTSAACRCPLPSQPHAYRDDQILDIVLGPADHKLVLVCGAKWVVTSLESPEFRQYG